MEAELAAEFDLDPGYKSTDSEQAQNDVTESRGPTKGNAGHSHSNQPSKKVWHFKTHCLHYGATRCLRRGKTVAELCNDFDEDGMSIKVVCHIGYLWDVER